MKVLSLALLLAAVTSSGAFAAWCQAPSNATQKVICCQQHPNSPFCK